MKVSHFGSATIALFLALVMGGCNGGAGSDGGDLDLVGVWVLNSMHEKGTRKTTVNGTTTTANVDSTTVAPAGWTMEFKADNSFTSKNIITVNGTWSASGNKVTTVMTAFGQTDTTVMSVSIDGKVGTFVSHETDVNSFGGTTVAEDLTLTVKATKQ